LSRRRKGSGSSAPSRLLSLLLAAGLAASALWPTFQFRREARRVAARVSAVASRAGDTNGACLALDPALFLRVQRLGPWLSSWETIGGCGAGGANGTGVKWIGHNTTGGMFQLMVQNNFITVPSPAGRSETAFNNILNTQISRDLTDKWNVGISAPYIYKYYSDYQHNGVSGPLSNAGLGDMSALVTRRLGPINATSLTGIVGVPTGTYNAFYMNGPLTPDQQLGFGRFTGSLLLDHTLDKSWGLIVLGGAANYRGGKQTDKLVWFINQPSQHNYRAPGASLYGYAGYFLGPLVPALGLNVTGFTGQDTRGDFGENVDAPVATAALHASVEWSNPYMAVLLGTYVPYAIRGQTWARSGGSDSFGLQPWTVALGVSVSPF
jgi:hypothetical protein